MSAAVQRGKIFRSFSNSAPYGWETGTGADKEQEGTARDGGSIEC